jgi:hypothetical protein
MSVPIIYQGEFCFLHHGGKPGGFTATFLFPPDVGEVNPLARFKTGNGTGQQFGVAIVALGEEGEPVSPVGRHSSKQRVNKAGPKGPYGQQAKTLRKSGFFNRPVVWHAIGTDKKFLEWIRTRPCISCNAPAPSEAAHVRRVANGSGTGTKPEFSAIPLCKKCHSDQHNHGESSIGGKEQVNKWRSEVVQSWGWASLRETLGFESWAMVPPPTLREWATENGVFSYLPSLYRVTE